MRIWLSMIETICPIQRPRLRNLIFFRTAFVNRLHFFRSTSLFEIRILVQSISDAIIRVNDIDIRERHAADSQTFWLYQFLCSFGRHIQTNTFRLFFTSHKRFRALFIAAFEPISIRSQWNVKEAEILIGVCHHRLCRHFLIIKLINWFIHRIWMHWTLQRRHNIALPQTRIPFMQDTHTNNNWNILPSEWVLWLLLDRTECGWIFPFFMCVFFLIQSMSCDLEWDAAQWHSKKCLKMIEVTTLERP